jgi:hypothetical protein
MRLLSSDISSLHSHNYPLSVGLHYIGKGNLSIEAGALGLPGIRTRQSSGAFVSFGLGRDFPLPGFRFCGGRKEYSSVQKI